MSSTFTTRNAWSLSLLGLLVLAMVVGTFGVVREQQKVSFWVKHTLVVKSEAQQAMSSLVSAENCYRGYLVTHDAAYTTNLASQPEQTMQAIDKLIRLTDDNPAQQKLLPDLKNIASRRLATISQKLATHDSKTSDLTAADQQMQEFRKLSDQVIANEDELLVARNRRMETTTMSLYLMVGGIAVWSIISLVLIYRSLRNYSALQTKAQTALSLKNDELAATNKEIERARDAAQSANDLKSKFVASVSHEIRTPLSGIIGLSELLACGTPVSPEEMKKMCNGIFDSAKGLLAILNDLLDFSKLEAGRMEIQNDTFMLDSVLSYVNRIVQNQVGNKNLRIVQHVDENVPPQCFGDALRIRQVLLNLVSNAVKFTEHGEVSITVSLQNCDSGKPRFIKYAVRDTGIGITEEAQKKLFSPFQQADSSTTRRYGGTGLGLSISKRLVELMGGDIGVDSKIGEGSTFWFVVPFLKSDTDRNDRPNVTGAAASKPAV